MSFYCTCTEKHDPACEWEWGQPRPVSTKIVQTETATVDGETVESSWFYWLIQKTKDAAVEADFEDFGDEVHCLLKDARSGRVLGERVYMKGIE